MSGQPPPAGGMSLYANLLEPKAKTADSTSISRAPISFKPAGAGDSSAPKKALDPDTLRFQPIRRPQPAQKPKPKMAFPKIPGSSATAAPALASSSTPASDSASLGGPQAAPSAASETTDSAAPPPAAAALGRKKLSDWVATEEDEYMYGTGEKRQRGGRRHKKKKGQRDGDGRAGQVTDWDELYDPARPTNVEEYLRSDERIAEIREWKAVIYAHRRRRQRRRSTSSRSSDDEREHVGGSSNQFVPPPSYSFAPPPPSPPRQDAEAGAGSVPADDATGDNAYARRMALSGVAAVPAPPPPPSPPRAESPHQQTSHPTPPPPFMTEPGGTISRAAVRYDKKATDEMDVDEEYGGGDGQPRAGLGAAASGTENPEEDGEPQEGEARSNRPGQAGFAARMMSKMGWQKGTGLGADGTGIVTGLSVKVEKRKRRPDAEGGGFAEPAGKGRVVGGKRAPNAEEDAGKFGRMTEVVLLRGTLDGMENLAEEVANGLGQEIGEECGEKYGRVERLYIDVENRQVFIKFTDQVSALRAVNALVGRVFNGNTIEPSFYDSEKFEGGIYV